MRARQLETSACVIESAVRPLHRVVADFAGRGKRTCDVIHRRQSVAVVLLMARIAGRAGQVVVVVDVAIRTLTRRDRVRTGQGEAGAVVVECRVQPRTRIVALIAALGEV